MNLAKTHSGGARDNSETEELGEMILHAYSPMGKLAGSYGSVEVEAREMLIPARHVASQSIRFELSSGGDYPQTGIAVISSESIISLIAALEKLQTATINQDRFEFTEIQCVIDDLKITVFNNDRGSLMWAMATDGVSVHFSSLKLISRFVDLIEQAKSHLEKHRI